MNINEMNYLTFRIERVSEEKKRILNKIVRIIIMIIIIAEVLDFITTAIGIHLGFGETCPLIPIFGWIGSSVIKILATVFMVLWLICFYKILPRYSTILGIILAIVAIKPVVGNLTLLLELVR